MPHESVRLAGEFGEDRLGDVCRSCRVATDLPNGGRVDQVQVAAHHLLERRFRPVLRVAADQFGLFGHGGFQRHRYQPMSGEDETAQEI